MVCAHIMLFDSISNTSVLQNRSTQRKEFSCCRTSSAGCTTFPTHNYAHLDPRLGAKYRSFAPTPAASSQKLAFRAVTIDCEMAGVAGMVNEVILICAADYFTGTILLNKLVCQAEKVTSWRISIHGIKRSVMETAVLQGQTLAGWKEARQELWKFIDDTTILVGHALQHGLDVLRMIHPRIVDSAILGSNAVGTRVRQWGLKTLCQEFLSIEMRNNKGEVHDCMEDVLATREVVL
jgi:DNA polymerase III epsilon subunit-like protein